MKHFGLNELRELFLRFFETKNHLRLPSFSLIPQNDASLLLINSGMAPMKAYFKGEQEPPSKRICTCQKCIRTGDIDNIGKTARHGTFFEMLGNFSFGDYFKEEAIAWSWEFLTSPEWVGIAPDRLYPSVYIDDDEAFNIWNINIGIPKDRIFRFGKEENFWEHGAGPCGPCSEIYYDRGIEFGCGKETCTVGCDCDRFMEVWNNVFSQFDNDGNGNYTELAQKNIDTGMGLERLAVVCQGVNSLFEVDTVMSITDTVSKLTGIFYGQTEKGNVSLRVITDHIRSGVFLVCDGVLPSNEGRGYVLRRLLRRAARHGKLLGVNGPFLYKIVKTVVENNKTQYPELELKYDYIVNIIENEEKSFAKTIDTGLTIFNDLLLAHNEKGDTLFSGADAFKLYDTYGFPLDLTIEMCEDEGMKVDEADFLSLMEDQRIRARKATEALGDRGWSGIQFGKDVPNTEFVGYLKLNTSSTIVSLLEGERVCDKLCEGAEGIIVLDSSPFYAEMGGQVSDTGYIRRDGAEFRVNDVQKNKGGKYLHYGLVVSGDFSVGDEVSSYVDRERRSAISRAHSATHLLHKALQELCGEHVHQAGSFVNEDYLRFDFSHFSPLSDDEIRNIEFIVNNKILDGLGISCEEMNLENAKKTHATALFGEKYGDSVRVVSMGDYSVELCGGTHLDNTAKIGSFRIITEASIASGIRRVEAYTGLKTLEHLNTLSDTLNILAFKLKTKGADLINKVEQQAADLKEANRIIEQYKAKEFSGNAGELLKSALDINGVHFVSERLENADIKQLRSLGDVLRDKDEAVVAVLATENGDKVSLLCVCGKTAVKKGVYAGDLIKTISPAVGGKGGGKPDSAMGGGSNPNGIDEAFSAAEKFVREKLGV